MFGQRRIVVAGEMLELGPSGETMHRDCGQQMGVYGIDFVLGVRGLAKHIVEGAAAANVEGEFVATPEEAGEWLRHHVKPGDLVLVKASRGVRLERALQTWMDGNADTSH
jgi:UDP-N-acetylmuramoyl-tripeptide--D-alanyl-D-alanine ligase